MDHLASRFLLKTFWDTVDHFLFLVAANLVTFLLTLTVAGAPFGMAGLFACAARAAEGGEPDWATYRAGARRGAAAMTAWLLALAATPVSVVAALGVYPALLGAAGHLLAGLTLWLGGALLLVLLLAPPGLFLGGGSPARAFRGAAVMLLCCPGTTLFVGVWGVLLLLFTLLAFPIMLPFAAQMLLATGSTSAWAVMRRRLVHLAARADAVGSVGAPGAPGAPGAGVPPPAPRTWREVREREAAAKAGGGGVRAAPGTPDTGGASSPAAPLPYMARDEMARSWRELIRPWEG